MDQTTFRSRGNRENNYPLDRRVQKTGTFTGIDAPGLAEENLPTLCGRSDRAR